MREERQTKEASPRALDRLALSCTLLWATAVALTPVVGIWVGIGAAAIGLGAASLRLAPSVLLPLLRPTPRLLALGTLAAFVMVAATYGLYPPISRASAGLTAAVGVLYPLLTAAQPFWLPRVLLPFIILAEELIWRGVVFEALSRRLPLPPTVLLSALIYAGIHLPIGSPLLLALALLCGFFWSTLRAATGSLVPGLLSHLVWDLLVFLLWPLA
jgi:membrane protease YdiL (CAAX protease family)